MLDPIIIVLTHTRIFAKPISMKYTHTDKYIYIYIKCDEANIVLSIYYMRCLCIMKYEIVRS